jgi:hypothetical protein
MRLKLEHEADFVAEQLEQITMAVDFDFIDDDAATVGFVEAAEQVKEGAFAAAGGSAEGDGLALLRFKVDAAQHRDGAVVEALPHVFGAEDNAAGARGLCGQVGHSKRSASTARIRMA